MQKKGHANIAPINIACLRFSESGVDLEKTVGLVVDVATEVRERPGRKRTITLTCFCKHYCGF